MCGVPQEFNKYSTFYVGEETGEKGLHGELQNLQCSEKLLFPMETEKREIKPIPRRTIVHLYPLNPQQWYAASFSNISLPKLPITQPTAEKCSLGLWPHRGERP